MGFRTFCWYFEWHSFEDITPGLCYLSRGYSGRKSGIRDREQPISLGGKRV